MFLKDTKKTLDDFTRAYEDAITYKHHTYMLEYLLAAFSDNILRLCEASKKSDIRIRVLCKFASPSLGVHSTDVGRFQARVFTMFSIMDYVVTEIHIKPNSEALEVRVCLTPSEKPLGMLAQVKPETCVIPGRCITDISNFLGFRVHRRWANERVHCKGVEEIDEEADKVFAAFSGESSMKAKTFFSQVECKGFRSYGDSRYKLWPTIYPFGEVDINQSPIKLLVEKP